MGAIIQTVCEYWRRWQEGNYEWNPHAVMFEWILANLHIIFAVNSTACVRTKQFKSSQQKIEEGTHKLTFIHSIELCSFSAT